MCFLILNWAMLGIIDRFALDTVLQLKNVKRIGISIIQFYDSNMLLIKALRRYSKTRIKQFLNIVS